MPHYDPIRDCFQPDRPVDRIGRRGAVSHNQLGPALLSTGSVSFGHASSYRPGMRDTFAFDDRRNPAINIRRNAVDYGHIQGDLLDPHSNFSSGPPGFSSRRSHPSHFTNSHHSSSFTSASSRRHSAVDPFGSSGSMSWLSRSASLGGHSEYGDVRSRHISEHGGSHRLAGVSSANSTFGGGRVPSSRPYPRPPHRSGGMRSNLGPLFGPGAPSFEDYPRPRDYRPY